ncbi:MAG TPA: hypothetical protein VFB80_01830 [Pirellulaceae bacterium]|nr:hypothetical protein [Pirellulaceae bacterium]
MLTIRGLSLTNLPRVALAGWRPLPRPLHVLICVADHFEPQWQRPPASVAHDRAARWRNEYPRLAGRYKDSRGQSPQHTFFFPAEEYQPDHVEALAELCRLGLGDVEVHLHHDNDTSDRLRQTLGEFTSALHQEHGLLARDAAGGITYGFIHGNWALDNSRPDGRWCGVNDELTVLRQTGCYADFTMPSAPAACQTTTINSIYYATDDPLRPKSHDRGVAARVGVRAPDGSLLMIQGPLVLDWRQRKHGMLPRIENGDLTALRPPSLDRLWSWLAAGVYVAGREDWRFIKLHTHGAQEANSLMLLGEPMERFHSDLARFAAEHDWFHFYYVTARQMAELVHAAEQGRSGSPAEALTQQTEAKLPADLGQPCPS